MSYPIFGNLSLGNVSGNIKLFVNHSGLGNLTGIGYNNNAMTFGVNQSASATPEMIINRIGDVDILGNVYTGGNVVVNAIAPSTSITTGALQVAGGAGIRGNLNIGLDSFFNGNVQLTQTNNPLWFVSNNASTINSTLASGSDVGIFYGPTNPAAAGLVISPRGIGGGIKMSISGNVGINTTTPRFTFDVNGIIGIENNLNNKKLVLYDNAPTDNPNTATNFYGFGINSGMLRYQVDTVAATHAFYGGSTEYMRIVAGNMGIGTTNPQARLDVTSTGQNAVTIEVGDVSNTNVLRLIGNLTTGGFNNISQSNDVGIIYGTSAGSLTNKLVIAPWATGPSGIRMDQNGNVGIGTTNPHTALDVNGTLRLNAPITQTYTAYVAGTSPSSTQIGYTFTTSMAVQTFTSGTAASNSTNTAVLGIGVWLITWTASFTSSTTATAVTFNSVVLYNATSNSNAGPVLSGYSPAVASVPKSFSGSHVLTQTSATPQAFTLRTTVTYTSNTPSMTTASSITVVRIA